MHPTIADSDEPGLRIWATGQKPVRRRQGTLSHLERAGFYIDGDDLAYVAFFYLLPYLSFVDFTATSGELFFAVLWL